ncbi:MAG: hypothetical protein KAW93_10550, partial [Methanogenium sp.]|nr:hypothetical protein [Methanogenium sp.]
MDETNRLKVLFWTLLALSIIIVPVAADETVVREIPTSVLQGNGFNVKLVINDIEVGAVMETIPQECTYLSCTCPEDRIKISGNNLIISLIETEEITYTLRADKTGLYSFTGIWDNTLDEINGTINESKIR